MKLLIINPGSTSTKISLFEDEKNLFTESLFHDAPELLKYPHVNDQVGFRTGVILDFLKEHGTDPSEIDVFVGRGGSACSQHAGVTVIDEKLYEDTRDNAGGTNHPAKLGVMIAYELCRKYGGQMFTLNPTNVDELCDLARPTGIKGIYRKAQTHVLNQKAIGAIHAAKLGEKYEDFRFIICHIDGGITVTAHEYGRMIDSTEGAGGDGPFTPTRLGSIPVSGICEYLDMGHTTADLKIMLSRSGGFVSHFGTSNADTIHEMIDAGDSYASLIWDTMCYQLCKSIGAMATVLKGKVDAILLTGGLVRFNDLVEFVRERCGFIAPISVYPGEAEQEAMAEAVLDVLRGRTEAQHYSGKPVFTGFGECAKAVIFDLDGTLIDTERIYRQIWPESMRQLGYEFGDDRYLELRSLGKPYAPAKFREWYGDDFDYDAARARRKVLFDRYIEEHGIDVKPGAKELIKYLREHGIMTAVATATDPVRRDQYMKMTGLDGLFDRVISATDVDEGKPSPKVYLYACEQLGLKPCECIAVEDAPNGILSAYRAGLRVAMVPDQSEPDDDIRRMLWVCTDRLDKLMQWIG